MNQDIFLAILTDMDEAFYSSNLAQYRDKREELICHVCPEALKLNDNASEGKSSFVAQIVRN